ncbi:MAG: hypothetical protein WBL25_04415 [Anaerolineales bacterium]
MNWRIYLLLFILGLVVLLGTASLQDSPGYLDSDYYYVGGLQLVEGKGFTEPFLWNYLDEPVGLPHPSHTYWFPLSSILAAISMFVSGPHTYETARLIFILIAACIPPLTARLALDVTASRGLSLTSGLLAVFSVYYLPFLPVTDNYAPFIALGGLIFLLMKKERRWVLFIMGLLVGLMNLARSDGLLWLGLVGLLLLWRSFRTELPLRTKIQSFVYSGSLVAVGYLLVMGPWYARNIAVFGSLMAPGGSRILWLTNYNDTFAFPANQINMDTWLQAGLGAALKIRLWALKMNLLNAFAAQGSILLFPFILLGFWQQRHDVRVKFAATGWLILLIVMTVVFPLAGARGGFFHAGAAFQTFWWVLAPLGLNHFVKVLRDRKIFTARHAKIVFQGMLVVVCAMLSGVIIQMRILQPGWHPEFHLYEKVEQVLVGQGAASDEIAVVRNPALYYIVSGRSTIVMPPGGPDTILAVAKKYNASYFVLEPEGVLEEYKQLYEQFDVSSGLIYIGEVEGARIYAIHNTTE